MDFTRKISFLVFALCVLFSLKNQKAETNKASSSSSRTTANPPSSTSTTTTSSSSSSTSTASSSPDSPMFYSIKVDKKYAEAFDEFQSLQYDFYQETCPEAEPIIRSTLRDIHQLRPDISPALLRLVFHDCFIEGCDASVLLDAADRISSEKDSPPNQSLRGFDIIDIIKSELERECPGTVSCADLLVLAARESVVLAGGPFYPLHTGRRDGTISYPELATYELPSPQDDLSRTIALFASRGFDERETVSLLGAHSTGMIHCKFFRSRLNNFRGTSFPDPTLDIDFLNLLRSKCDNNHTTASSPLSSSSLSPSISATSSLHLSPSASSPSSLNVSAISSTPDSAMKMDYEGPGRGFGTLYYRSLLQGKGLLYVDQQLTTGEETETWVRAYASDVNLFQRDFALVMMKLSDYRVLTAPIGQVRRDCRKVV